MAKTKVAITFLVKDPGVVVEEYLRYAGIISVLGMGHTGYVPIAVTLRLPRPLGVHKALVTMSAPEGIVKDAWIRQNLDRLASFGVLAVGWQENTRGLSILGQTRSIMPQDCE